MVQELKKLLRFSYTPISNFPVASIVVTKDGKYYKGVEGNIIPGLEIFEYYTEAIEDRKKRCIGNIVINAKIGEIEMKMDNNHFKRCCISRKY